MNALKSMKEVAPLRWRTVYYGISRADGRLLRRGYSSEAARKDEAEILGLSQAMREMFSPRLVSVLPADDRDGA